MDTTLSEEEVMIRESARKFLETHCTTKLVTLGVKRTPKPLTSSSNSRCWPVFGDLNLRTKSSVSRVAMIMCVGLSDLVTNSRFARARQTYLRC